jgi:hypothetical protein
MLLPLDKIQQQICSHVPWKALTTIDAIRCPIILPPETSIKWIMLQTGTILACWGQNNSSGWSKRKTNVNT